MTRRSSLVTTGALLLAALTACGPDERIRAAATIPVSVPAGVRASPASAARSVLLITTDDQNVSDLAAMPLTHRLLAAHGMTFTQALSPHPLCCPARAEILTGQYAHNNGVRHNDGRFGRWWSLDATRTLATSLQAAGYHTAFTGKYLNGFGRRSPRPPGWDVWDPMVARIYRYWGTEFEHPRAGDQRRYSVDAVADRTGDVLRRFAADDRPFFVWSSQVAPHASPDQQGSWDLPRPPRAAGPLPGRSPPALANPTFTTRPGHDSTCVCDRTSWTRAYVRRFHRARLQTLQAVDRAVASAVRVLARSHRLDDTYVVFTTDNALLMGEHGIFGKSMVYEEDLRIPLLVRGPSIPEGSRSSLPATLVDLAPTILDIASVPGADRLDGRSFLPTLHGETQVWRDTQLIQTGALAPTPLSSGWGYRGVRTRRYTYAVQPDTGEELLFDRRLDPYEQHDRAGDPAYRSVVSELRRRTALLTSCAGPTCSRRFGPEPGRVSVRGGT